MIATLALRMLCASSHFRIDEPQSKHEHEFKFCQTVGFSNVIDQTKSLATSARATSSGLSSTPAARARSFHFCNSHRCADFE